MKLNDGERIEVKVRTALQWYCPCCFQRNWVDPIVKFDVVSGEQKFREIMEIEPWQELPDNWRDHDIAQVPETVKCDGCDKTFPVM